jgi:hypothetical protein
LIRDALTARPKPLTRAARHGGPQFPVGPDQAGRRGRAARRQVLDGGPGGVSQVPVEFGPEQLGPE